METTPLLVALHTPALTLATWEAYDPSVKVDLTSNALRVGERVCLFDPIPFADGTDVAAIMGAPATAIILTNGNHERYALEVADALQLPILAPAAAFPEFTPALAARAIRLEEANLPLEAIPLPGGGAGETAYYTPEADGVAVVGDALINLPFTGFCLLPEKYCEDVSKLRCSVTELARRPLAALAFSHGQPLLEGIAEKIAALP